MARSGARAVAALALVATFAACAGDDADVPRSTFLGDLGRLTRVEGTQGFAAWKRPDTDLSRYKRVLLDPVEVRAAVADAGAQLGTNAPELQRIRTYYRQSAMLAVNNAYPVTDAPGRDVVRIHAQIAGLEAVRAAGDAAGGDPLPFTLHTRHATIETELRDSVTGERVAAIVERPAPDAALVSWPTIERTLDRWSKLLPMRLDALRAR